MQVEHRNCKQTTFATIVTFLEKDVWPVSVDTRTRIATNTSNRTPYRFKRHNDTILVKAALQRLVYSSFLCL